jgi:hypothetical protein
LIEPNAESHKLVAQGDTRERALARAGAAFNEHLDNEDGPLVFAHACKMGLEGIVSKRMDSRYRSGRSLDWIKSKKPNAPTVKREVEEDRQRQWNKSRAIRWVGQVNLRFTERMRSY